MTQSDLDEIIKASKPTPMIALQCGAPTTPQANANAAWKLLGDKMGFDHMTVEPTGKGDRFFKAFEIEKKKKNADAIKPLVRQSPPKMTERELRCLLTLLMCDDPTSLDKEDHAQIMAFAERESKSHGFNDWVQAYHAL